APVAPGRREDEGVRDEPERLRRGLRRPPGQEGEREGEDLERDSCVEELDSHELDLREPAHASAEGEAEEGGGEEGENERDGYAVSWTSSASSRTRVERVPSSRRPSSDASASTTAGSNWREAARRSSSSASSVVAANR